MWRWIHSGGAVEAVSIWFGAGFTVAVCTALGALAFGRVLKEWPQRFVTGAALLSLIVFALACVRLVYPAVFLVVGVISLGLWLRRERPRRVSLRIWSYALASAFAAYFLLYFINSMAPEASPDGATYHLGLVSRFLREHGFHVITWNMYASLSEGMEMLFLFPFALGKHSAASMLHFAFLVALTWQIITYGRRIGSPILGGCAALLVFASPLVGKDATSAYNDVALACAAFTLFWLLQVWNQEKSASLLIPIGLVAGFCYALKFTGGVAIIYAMAVVAWGGKQARPVMVVAGWAAVLAFPWLIKNWIWVGNPVSPLFNHLFPNPYVTTWFEDDYRRYLRLYELTSRWQIPLAVTVRGELAGVLGPVFLLSPLALLAWRRAEGRQLLLAAAVFGCTYFSNIGARFLIPPLPFFALAMMIGVSFPPLAMGIALLHAVISWPTLVPRYAMPGAWTLREIPVRYAMRFRPAAEYLREKLPQYRLDELIERVTEPGATVLTNSAIPEAYTSRRILVEYESAENHQDAATLWSGFLRPWMPTWRAGFSFSRQPLLGFRVVQTADGKDTWRIHELRAFDGPRELSRNGWLASARPFPWGIERAFDGNAVTFWECGDPLSAGSYVEAEFPQARTVDSVLLESSPNQPELRMALYGETAPGVWKRIAGPPDIFNGTAQDWRRAAVLELKRRGIGYVLLFDADQEAAAVRKGAAVAGMLEVGEAAGARLYRLQ